MWAEVVERVQEEALRKAPPPVRDLLFRVAHREVVNVRFFSEVVSRQ